MHFRSPSSTSRSSVNFGSGAPGNDNRESGSLDKQRRRVTIWVLQGFASLCKPPISKQFAFSALPHVTPYCVPVGVSGRTKALASAARVATCSCKLLGGDGPLAQQVGVRAARRGGVPALAPPQPTERRSDERPSAPRSPLAPRARRPGRGGCGSAGRPRTTLATGPFRRRRSVLSSNGKSSQG